MVLLLKQAVHTQICPSTVQNLGLDIGNTFFVLQNGNDDTDAGSFRILKRALDVADASTSDPQLFHKCRFF